jgi:outer membrane protein OmpA-like peptidoglycan-associated protein
MAAPSAYTVSNLRAANTSFSDWGAEWYGDHSIVFTSDSLRTRALGKGSRADREIFRRTGHPFQKVYVADSTTRGVGAIRGFAPVMNFNTYHDGPVAFSPGGDTAYFTVTNPDAPKDLGDKVSYREGKKVVTWTLRRLEILWTAKDSSGNWGPSHPFAYNNPTHYSVGHAALSPDGQILYFTSDMPGGYGRTDIWYVRRQGDGSWSAPVNCGPEVNTEDEEAFPTIGKDGRLYFASKGHAGMGGYDVFVGIGQANQWQSVRNLGYPLNSSGDDFYFTVKDSLSGFLSSDRPGGKGSDDIYQYVVMAGPPVPGETFPALRVIVLKTQVLDSASGEPIDGAAIVVSHVKKGLRWTTITGPDGMDHQVIEPEAEYKDSAFKKGYAAGGTHVSTVGVKGPDTLSVQVFLQKSLITGVVYILKNLYYDYNKSYIRPDAALVLDKLVAYLRQYPHLAIELSSHTDSRGADAYNLSLSMRRAQAALKYLQSHGVAPGRVTIHGYGETRLVNGCSNNVPCTPAQHQANRRTEIRVLHP